MDVQSVCTILLARGLLNEEQVKEILVKEGAQRQRIVKELGGAGAGARRRVEVSAPELLASFQLPVPGEKGTHLTEDHIARIVETYQHRKEEKRYSKRVEMEEIEGNDFNLNIPRYVDTFEEEKEIDIDAVQQEIDALEKELVQVRAKMVIKLKEIER